EISVSFYFSLNDETTIFKNCVYKGSNNPFIWISCLAANYHFLRNFMLLQHSYAFICDELMTMRLMLTTILWLVLLYLALCAAAWSYQSRLIFPGAKAGSAHYQTYAEQQIQLQRDDVKLEGWAVTNPEISADEDTVLIYYGGNGEDVVTMLPKLEKFGAASIYAFNYRGYGNSEGRATQESLFEDALAIHDYVSAQHSHHARIVIVGRSLGTAVAG